MSQRSYEDACGTALALDVVGERWALLVVRELVFGPKRFRDLRAGLPKASQNVLSQRLRELEDSGVVRKVELGPPVSAVGLRADRAGPGAGAGADRAQPLGRRRAGRARPAR